MKPTLTIMIGISASGKSSYAESIKDDNTVIVSSDAIRKEICSNVSDQSKNNDVFCIFHERIKENLLEGRNVIADATNITVKSRKAIFDNIGKIKCTIVGIIMAKSCWDCITDNEIRENPVPDQVISKQVSKFQIPFEEEGFNEIHIIHYGVTIPTTFLKNNTIITTMDHFDQHSKYHNLSLGDHSRFVYENFDHRISGLYHDVGKLMTQEFDENGFAHYYGHENVGTYFLLFNSHCEDSDLDDWLNELFIVNYHMLPFGWETEKAKDRWRRRFGEKKFNELMRFHEIDMIRKYNNKWEGQI